MNASEPVELSGVVAARLGLSTVRVSPARLHDAHQQAAKFLAVSPGERLVSALAVLPLQTPAWETIIDTVTVGETSFMRQRRWFAQLERHVLGEIVARKYAAGDRRLRIWSAGCSTGEEVYSLAIAVSRLIGGADGWDVAIYGTDINERSLAHARHAVYADRSLRELEPEERARYFTRPSRDRNEVCAAIRASVSFHFLNLAHPQFPPGWDSGFDLLVCRNVLMHLTHDAQDRVAAILRSQIAPDGWLAVTAAEALPKWFEPLAPVNVPSAIFFRHVEQRAPVAALPPIEERRRVVPPRPLRPRKSRAPVEEADELERIRAVADSGDLASAKLQCEAVLAGDCLSYEANILLTVICDAMGDFRAALVSARNAVYLRPDCAVAHHMMVQMRTRAQLENPA